LLFTVIWCLFLREVYDGLIALRQLSTLYRRISSENCKFRKPAWLSLHICGLIQMSECVRDDLRRGPARVESASSSVHILKHHLQTDIHQESSRSCTFMSRVFDGYCEPTPLWLLAPRDHWLQLLYSIVREGDVKNDRHLKRIENLDAQRKCSQNLHTLVEFSKIQLNNVQPLEYS
jgi:hypothetical protein